MLDIGPASVFRDVYNQSFYKTNESRRRIFHSTKDSKDYLQRLDLLNRLKVHRGCVNTVCWNDKGQYLLSGSDDQTIVISNPFTKKILVQYKTPHRANIFSAKFMPQSNDRGIVSCSGDGIVIYTELTGANLQGSQNEKSGVRLFNCHNSGTTYEVMTVLTEPKSFMSCGEDGTVRLFDLRQISSCHKTCCKDNILIFSPSAITAMALSPISNQYIAVGSSDSSIRIYDRRYLSIIDFSTGAGAQTDRHTRPVKAFTIPSSAKRTYRVTSVKYSSCEQELLVSYSSDYLYLFDVTKDGTDLNTLKDKKTDKRTLLDSPPPVRKLRLRGDWSDTGPDARPERDATGGRVETGQVRPQLQGTIMHRMTEVLSRMLADPRTRVGLSTATNDSGNDSVVFDSAAQELESFAHAQLLSESQAGPSTSNSGRTDGASTSGSSKYSSGANNHSLDSDDDDDDDSSSVSAKTNNLDGKLNNDYQSHDDNETATSLKEELTKIELESKQSSSTINFNYMTRKFVGHRNARTMIKESSFWGNDYVMSGSDCGHVFIWNRYNGKLEMLLQADQHVVNCLQPHPTLPYLATSGIDYDIKIWAPIRDQCGFDEKAANDLMERNAVMLEETKDTITVPAAFMIRMLACIHALRNRRTSNNGNETNNNSNNSSNNDNNSSSSSSNNNNNNNNRNNNDSNNNSNSNSNSNNDSNN